MQFESGLANFTTVAAAMIGGVGLGFTLTGHLNNSRQSGGWRCHNNVFSRAYC
jgi:hypothetical protein